MKNRNEAFGRLLKAGIASIANCEGKTAAAVEGELGQGIGVSADTIQRYKTGFMPSEPRTIQILAEASVKRGFLGREWLQRFLHVARYPFAERLLEELFPAPQARLRPPRIYENLPAPTYSQFVMRDQAFAEVLDGLQQRSPAVIIFGLGGNGKTSIAREVAAQCLYPEFEPRFDAVVWVSDKDRPGTTNLSIVLDEIARTLDYPGFAQLEHDEKRHEVEQILRHQRVLLVVDNFETVTDGALLNWLLRLPEPSKVIITTREYHREFRRGSWSVELHGMSEKEALGLIYARARALKIERFVGDSTALKSLIVVTGGNPKALTIALGLVKYERRSLHEVIDDLHAARIDLFDDLFMRTWALLDETARRVLMVATFFLPNASDEALRFTADVQGYNFAQAEDKLVELALLDVHPIDVNSISYRYRYGLHPLVFAFAKAKLGEYPDFEDRARDRWEDMAFAHLRNLDIYKWEDNREQVSNIDHDQESVFAAFHRASIKQRHKNVLLIAHNFSDYCHVRGHWNRKLEIESIRLMSARADDNESEEVRALSSIVTTFSRQGALQQALPYFNQLQEVINMGKLTETMCSRAQIASGVYWMYLREFEKAQQLFLSAINSASVKHVRHSANSHRWLGVCLYRMGHVDDAQQALHRVLETPRTYENHRILDYAQLILAAIDIDKGNFVRAEDNLVQIFARANHYFDKERKALIQYQFSRLYTLRGEKAAARSSLEEAIDLFTRLNMHQELIDARRDLDQLEEQISQ